MGANNGQNHHLLVCSRNAILISYFPILEWQILPFYMCNFYANCRHFNLCDIAKCQTINVLAAFLDFTDGLFNYE